MVKYEMFRTGCHVWVGPNGLGLPCSSQELYVFPSVMATFTLQNALFYLDTRSRAFYWQVSTDIKRKSNLKYACADLSLFPKQKDVRY